MTCPQCGAPLVEAGGWPAWCEACDWGVDPEPPEHHASPLMRWWQRRLDAAVHAERSSAMSRRDDVGRRHRLVPVVFAAAVAMHLVTIGLVVATVVAAMSGIALVLKIVIGAVCIGIALVVAPRPWPRHRTPPGWSRSDAPQLFALLDAVAASVGGQSPALVVVTDAVATTLVGRGRRRTLSVGLPLWRALTPDERVAMLAHHLSTASSRDIRRSAVVSTARRSLDDWLTLSRPSEMEQRVAARRRRRLPGRFSSDFRLSDALIPIGLAPFYLVVLGIGAVLRLAGLRCGHRAVYAADTAAASVVGSDATCSWLDVLLMADAVEASMALALRQDPGADLLDVAQAHPAHVPERERGRLRRRDELRIEGNGSDEPPLSARWALIAGRTPPKASIDMSLMAGADEELTRAEPDVRRELRTRLVDSGL